MGYQRERMLQLGTELMQQQPSLTGAKIAERLGVHRHTLGRALKADGYWFASLRQILVLERLERHFASPKPTSLKQVWTELGFSFASAFARYIRHATGRSPSELRANCILGHSERKRAKMSLDAKKHGGYLCARCWSPSHKVTKKP